MNLSRISLMIGYIVSILINSQVANTQITPGILTFHPAGGSIVYNWFSYVPLSIKKSDLSYILVTGIHGNIISDDYDIVTQESRIQAEGKVNIADTYKYINLTPVIPRSASNWTIYTVSLDRESFADQADFNQRADLKVNAIIDELISQLQLAGYNVSDKVFIEGFSAGGMFAQRYCLLHPERIHAIAAGNCGGSLTLPETVYNTIEMNWPVGVKDFDSLVGFVFNLSEYQSVPQYIYIGDLDIHNSTVEPGNYDLFTDAQRNFLITNFGATDPIRLKNQCDYLIGLGYNQIRFVTYTGVGHQYTQEIIDDIFAFFNQFKETGNTGGEDNDSSGGGCFIATAAYGSYMEPNVKILREFRDRYLLTNRVGISIVEIYYNFSPPIAEYITKHEAIRSIVHIVLFPVVGICWMSVNLGSFAAFSIIFFPIAVLFFRNRQCRRPSNGTKTRSQRTGELQRTPGSQLNPN